MIKHVRRELLDPIQYDIESFYDPSIKSEDFAATIPVNDHGHTTKHSMRDKRGIRSEAEHPQYIFDEEKSTDDGIFQICSDREVESVVSISTVDKFFPGFCEVLPFLLLFFIEITFSSYYRMN